MLGPFLIITAYLIGSISFGLLFARAKGVELREVGSGNTGATNAARAMGKKVGLAVLALDLAKGLVPSLIAANFLEGELALTETAATGFAAVVGHCFPIWHRFRGGKGVATAAGVMLALAPWAALGAIAIYVVLRKLSGISSVGSLGATAAGALIVGVQYRVHAFTFMIAAITVVIVLRHISNIQRLLRSEEKKP